MRILGVSKKWNKLKQPKFTTFRFTRKDKDWQINEVAQIVFKPRSKEREILGIAEIINKEPRAMAKYGNQTGYQLVSNDEAIADGFEDKWDKYAFKRAYFWMWEFLSDAYGAKRLCNEPMNKLTVKWLNGG